ncbi:hypothetical protein N7492_009635 [Penicillium capsulatum]|uniref:Uncharacterized protein n=1 Tax=Penicillium capsulatum TaxID=69766 RepID=A0A9W9HUP7_9EURO|nr:hypothetical protein N7492_009635 [Penicillium capsulatum]KAJ6107021.1 hypothetical protein N7512_010538 [Penicillium capsulatum]
MEGRKVPGVPFSEYCEQSQCPLFTVLPPEIRSEIFAHALTGAADLTQPPDQGNYCTRPGYENGHRTWTQLLTTCKRVYTEAWFMPFINSEHAFYMTSDERRPQRVASAKKLQQSLDLIRDRHGGTNGGSIRIFSQLAELETTKDFQGIFTMRHFRPTNVAITIRYTDTWYWESNSPLRIKGSWGERLILPASVSCFQIELESIERRKEEVDYVATEAATKWHFTRSDGTRFLSKPSNIAITRWSGSSMLGRERWVRDEARPGQLDYYVATVTWRPSPESPKPRPDKNPDIRVDWDRPAPKQLEYDSIPEESLMYARIPPNSTAEEAATAYYGFKHKSLMIIPS